MGKTLRQLMPSKPRNCASVSEIYSAWDPPAHSVSEATSSFNKVRALQKVFPLFSNEATKLKPKTELIASFRCRVCDFTIQIDKDLLQNCLVCFAPKASFHKITKPAKDQRSRGKLVAIGSFKVGEVHVMMFVCWINLVAASWVARHGSNLFEFGLWCFHIM